MSGVPESGLSSRRYDLDWLRIVAFGLLILYHAGMFYVSWDWHVKSSHAGREAVYSVLQPLMLLTNPWRLALLFLIAGCATRFMADKTARWPMMKSRTARLLLPLVFGMLVIVPPQAWYELVEKLNYDGSWLDFYGKYLTFYGGWRANGKPIIVPTWNHLWFVAYLWVYTMIVIGLRPLLHAVPLHGIAQVLRQPLVLLLLPPLFIGLLRLTLRPVFGETHALTDDWYQHAMYLSLFLFGYGIAKAEAIWRSIDLLRWPALVFALLAYAGLVWFKVGGPWRAMVWALDQWMWIIALLGFAGRWLNHDGSVRRYLTDAIFPFYILHQTIFITLGHHLSPFRLPVGIEAGLLIAVTALGCWVGYEIVRRVSWLRPLFGLRLGGRATV